jgi:hypothetical protein
MLDSVRPRAGTRSGRVTAFVACFLAMVLTFVFVLRTNSDSALTPQDEGPIGASVEAGELDALPFGKLVEEGGEEASEKAAAPSSVEFDELALVGRTVGEWEHPPFHRARALLGVIGARGPPVG